MTSYPMTDRLRSLEKTSRRIERSADELAAVTKAAVEYAERFLRQIDTLPAYVRPAHGGPERGLEKSPITDSPTPIENLLELLWHNVDRPGLNPASGGHL